MSLAVRVIPCLDVDAGRVVKGVNFQRLRDAGDPVELAKLYDAEGCARYVVTDVNKDGMLQGPNIDLLRSVCAATDRPVVASGGITELSDLEALVGLVPDGVEGAIIGTALYEGRFSLEEALALTSGARA